MFHIEYTNFITNETITLVRDLETLNEAYYNLFDCIDNESGKFDISFYSIHGNDGSVFFQDGDCLHFVGAQDISEKVMVRINLEKELYNVCTD